MVVINYVMSLGASVMMPIIFTIFGIILGLGVAKSLRAGISVGIGFVGLSVITKLLADNLGPAVSKMVELYGLNLKTLDIGWPAAAAVAYGTEVGAIVIPLGLLVNIIMLFTRTTNTVNIDLWNYWHFAFIGSIVSIATDSFLWGLFAVVVTVAITLIGADRSQKKMESFYGKDLEGISIPQAFCVGFIPFAIITDWIIEKIPGLNKVDLDAKKMQDKFGIFGEPLFLGVIVGILLGLIAQYSIAQMLTLGITMAAVMVLIPKITGQFIEGLNPISQRSQELIGSKLKGGRKLNIGMTPALVIGHPVTLVCSLLLVPIILFLSVIIPGNKFLPLASLSGLIYIFPLVLPYTKGNVLRSLITGILTLVTGVLFATSLSTIFTKAVRLVDGSLIPKGTESVASIDFAASPFSWITYQLTANIGVVGAIILGVLTIAFALFNRKKITTDLTNS
ncbi:PTS transporter subunit IIC [Enterococcus dongliensis]|uniref:PTS transporter subunit IIC n=1 Tax=Enterococcus dongliensis TaxID=2559925 RepID=A0AAP5NIR6_9ENTE|nr:PTS transporter subunit IIC [Enterococcus dongliensis]MDT2596198.1 PTS transporter subunit IIC [Enterococcus dongliensis]MDT2603919.1 PTS transporter subunit IIC [Enterococcus dongliensis]MDT2634185.1 PTS transporter subunit IIC [Enterococcus dongliensis]MDT2637115.1 PTS transporter subunit IIC [Enterococcus dongliensis]MDT2639982.1 PTS transporter subunit IIC [Enterococcus dongliensis]